jgi:hypothetical protein
MFEDRSGRVATTVEEAIAYLWRFIAENAAVTDKRVKEHSHDFDLYLPWLLQIFDRHGEQPGEKLSLSELESLYMDAAWRMVDEGFLRPGPRSVGGEQPRDGYGNGYALTAKGREVLASFRGGSAVGTG